MCEVWSDVEVCRLLYNVYTSTMFLTPKCKRSQTGHPLNTFPVELNGSSRFSRLE